MAVNKNVQIRYRTLDSCFSNRYKKNCINDLIDYCSFVLTSLYGIETSTSRHQIFSNIDLMKSDASGAEKAFDGTKATNLNNFSREFTK